MAQTVSRRPLKTEARVRSEVSPCEICDRRSGIWTGFFAIALVLLCQCPPTNSPYSSVARITNEPNLRNFKDRHDLSDVGMIGRNIPAMFLNREIIAVCSQIHTKHINTLCGQNVELLNVKLAVRIVTTGL